MSKEYLNIYHLTRKKAHPEIYEKLDETNKRILYDLHTIFIETRKNEYIVNNEIADKKSLTVDTVYKYLKKVDIDIIENIYLYAKSFSSKQRECSSKGNSLSSYCRCIIIYESFNKINNQWC